MVFLPFFSNVSKAYRGGGDGAGWVSGMGSGKNPSPQHPWSSHDTHIMAHATLVDHRGSGSNPRYPPPNWHPPLVPLFQSWFWRVSKIPSRKADQLTFNTWYTGDGYSIVTETRLIELNSVVVWTTLVFTQSVTYTDY